MFGIRKTDRAKTAEKITDELYFLKELANLDSNNFLLVDGDKDSADLALIDAGNALNSQNIIDSIKNLGFNPKNLKKLIITHEHLDHILGVFNLPEITNSDVEIIAFGETARTIREGDEETIAPRQLGISAKIFSKNIRPLDVTEVTVDDTIKFGRLNFSIHYTPGHSLGSMSLYEPDRKMLFPGDVVFCGGSFGRVDFPGGSAADLKKSINKLADLDLKYLCPGHMHISKDGNNEIEKSRRMINTYFR